MHVCKWMYIYHVNECMYINIQRVCTLYIDVRAYLYVWMLTHMDMNINGSVYIVYRRTRMLVSLMFVNVITLYTNEYAQ